MISYTRLVVLSQPKKFWKGKGIFSEFLNSTIDRHRLKKEKTQKQLQKPTYQKHTPKKLQQKSKPPNPGRKTVCISNTANVDKVM